jgi:hypothetical protein
MGRSRIRALIGVLLALLAACGEAPAPAPKPAHPAGTVLVFDGLPIRAEEVDVVASWFAQLEPRNSLEQLRRLALTNVIFPRLAATRIDPARREQAKLLAESYRKALSEGTELGGPLAGPLLETRSGRMLDLGMEIWNAALELPLGEWSAVLETAGAFHLVRPVKHGAGDTPALIELTVEVYDFPYLDPEHVRTQIREQLDRSRLESVDPAWWELVPTAWRHRLRGIDQKP